MKRKNKTYKRSIRILTFSVLLWVIICCFALLVIAATSSAPFSITDDNGNAKILVTATPSNDSATAKIEASTDGKTITVTLPGYTTDCLGQTESHTADYEIKLTNQTTFDDGTVKGIKFKITGVSGTAATGTYDYVNQEQDWITADTNELTLGTFTSGSGTKTTTVIFTIDILDVEKTETLYTTTFEDRVGGSYTVTVDGVAVDTSTPSQKVDGTVYTLNATEADGYDFKGWMSSKGTLDITGDADDFIYNSGENNTIWPLFVKEGSAMYFIKEASARIYYGYLDEATEAATEQVASSGSATIVVYESGTAYHSEESNAFSIGANQTLLIPFDSDYTVYTDVAGISSSATLSKTAYKMLTLSEGTNVTVDGSISVGGRIYSANGGAANVATIGGPYGRLHLEQNSSVTINGGLYAYGYVTGSGTVIASASSNIHEVFEIQECRGGTALIGSFGSKGLVGNSNEVFPFTQYYFQNIEAPMTLYSGAQLTAHAAMKISGSDQNTSLVVIGKNDGLFQLASGTMVKQYVPSEDRCRLDIYGSVKVASTVLPISYYEIDTSDYILPINGHFDINIKKDGNVEIAENVELLPGVRVTVDQEANLTVNASWSFYLYDSDQWLSSYVFGDKKLKPAKFSPTRTYTRSEADLTDVMIDVNGTVTVNGYLYTTTGGADIKSSQGTGTIVLNKAAVADKVIYQITGNTATFAEVNVTSAKLHNGANYANYATQPYAETSYITEADTYAYDATLDKWYNEDVTIHLADDAGTISSSENNYFFTNEDVSAEDYYAEDTFVTAVEAIPFNTTVLYEKAPIVAVWTGVETEQKYASLQRALMNGEYDGTGYVRMDADSYESSFSTTKTIYLDLNGKTVTLDDGTGTLTVTKLYGMDSATNAYTASDGKILGSVVGSDGNSAVADYAQYSPEGITGKYYVAHQDSTNNTWSFHRFDLGVDSYTFYTTEARTTGSMEFVAVFKGDSIALGKMAQKGFYQSGLSQSDDTTEGTNWYSGTDANILVPVKTGDDVTGYTLTGTISFDSDETNKIPSFADEFSINAAIMIGEDVIQGPVYFVEGITFNKVIPE